MIISSRLTCQQTHAYRQKLQNRSLGEPPLLAETILGLSGSGGEIERRPETDEERQRPLEGEEPRPAGETMMAS